MQSLSPLQGTQFLLLLLNSVLGTRALSPFDNVTIFCFHLTLNLFEVLVFVNNKGSVKPSILNPIIITIFSGSVRICTVLWCGGVFGFPLILTHLVVSIYLFICY